MRPLAVYTGAVLTALILGCRNDSGATPSSTTNSASSSASAAPAVQILLEADTSSVQVGSDMELPLQEVENAMRERLLKFGGYDVKTARQGSNRLSIQFRGVTSALAAKLLGRRAFLEIREPVLAQDRKVVCVSGTGDKFTVPVYQII